MHVKKFAMIMGIILLAVGVISFIPGLYSAPVGLPALNADASYGVFMGIPMNVFNKITLILFGLLGIGAASVKAKNLPYSIAYSRLMFAFFGVMAVLGLIPQTNTLGGYMPIFGNYVLVHAALSLLGAYFGFALSAKAPKLPEVNEGRQPTRSGTESFRHV